MSMTTANLAAALQRGPAVRAQASRRLFALHYAPLPMPFCWGPNGSLLLLTGMLAAYGGAVAVILFVTG